MDKTDVDSASADIIFQWSTKSVTKEKIAQLQIKWVQWSFQGVRSQKEQQELGVTCELWREWYGRPINL